MKKQLLFWSVCITTILSANAQTSVWDGSHTTWTKGTGTLTNPYLIENAAQLAHLAYVVNNGIGAGGERIVGTDTYWKLMTNINLNGSESFQWTPIGYYTSDADYFAFGGNFDGNGKTISNLFINTATLQMIGLFGYAEGASIKGIGIEGNKKISSESAYAGGIVGCGDNLTIADCYNTNTISGIKAGGIVGKVWSGTISNCYNTDSISSYNNSSSISSDPMSGGIVGHGAPIIDNCYNTGNISSELFYAKYSNESFSGGIVGVGSPKINNCYNTGNISSKSSQNIYYSSTNTYSNSGGIIGSGNPTINNCFNAGKISSKSTSGGHSYSTSGGIVGEMHDSRTINNCYNTGIIYSYSSDSYSGGIVGHRPSLWGSSIISAINNCYNVGNVETINGTYQGGILGSGYTPQISVNNSYYITTCGSKNTYGEWKTGIFMKTTEFVNLLNNGQDLSFKADYTESINKGFPILIWQSNQPSGIEEVKVNNTLTLYPNPVNDIFFIEYKNYDMVKIYDMLGKEVLSQNTNVIKEINIKHLSQGIYHVLVLSGGKIIGNSKIVKR